MTHTCVLFHTFLALTNLLMLLPRVLVQLGSSPLPACNWPTLAGKQGKKQCLLREVFKSSGAVCLKHATDLMVHSRLPLSIYLSFICFLLFLFLSPVTFLLSLANTYESNKILILAMAAGSLMWVPLWSVCVYVCSSSRPSSRNYQDTHTFKEVVL